MAGEFSLPEFIDHAKALLAEIPQAADWIGLASEPRWYAGSMIGEINRLGPVTVTWRLQLTKVTSHTLFFVFRTGQETDVVLDVNVTVRVRPLGALEQLPTDFAVHRFTATCPTCFPLNLSDADVQGLGPLGATRDNTLFFATGKDHGDIVAVKDAASNRPSLIFGFNGARGAVQPMSGKCFLGPLLAVLHELAIVSENATVSGAVPLTWSGAASSHLGVILNAILTAGSESAQSVAEASNKLQHPNWFQMKHLLAGYEANLQASVAANGSLAERPEDEQFKSRFALQVEGNSGRLGLGPADFALTGEEKGAFFGGLAVPSVRQAFARMLGTQREFAGAFLDAAKDDSAIVRVQRNGQREKYLMAFRGPLGNQQKRLLLSGEFHVAEAYEADTDTFRGVLFDVPAQQISADHQVMQYFFALIQNLKNWRSLLFR